MPAATLNADTTGPVAADTVIVTEHIPGPLQRTWNALVAHPFRSLLAIGATAGAGYLVYDYTRNGKTEQAVEMAKEAATIAADFMGR